MSDNLGINSDGVNNSVPSQDVDSTKKSLKGVDPKVAHAAVVSGLENAIDTAQSESKTSHAMPALMAVIEASQKSQDAGNEIITSLSSMANQIVEVTTKATTEGVQWANNYYNYGLSTAQSDPSQGIGQWSKGTDLPAGQITVSMKIEGGNYYMSIDGGKTYKNIGAIMRGDDGFVAPPPQSEIDAAFPGYTWPTDPKLVNENKASTYWHSGTGCQGDDQVFTMIIEAPDRTTGGTGIAGGAPGDMNDKLNQYSYIQNVNSEVNTANQTLAALPGALENTIVTSINQGNSNAKDILNAQDQLGNMIQNAG